MPPRYIAVPFTSGGAVIPIPTPTLGLTVVTGTQINLTETYVGPPGPLSFLFEQSLAANGPFVPCASGTSASVQITGLTPSTTYFFRARVQVNDGRFSDYTPVQSGTTLAQVPAGITGVNATATGQTTANVVWNTVSLATGYHVYRGGVLVFTTPSALVFNDAGLTPGTVYTYSVAAFNSAGEGGTGSDTIQTDPAAGGTTLRNNLGIYAFFNVAGGVSAGQFNQDKVIIAGTGPGDNLKGFAIHIYWRTIDRGGTSGPVYDWSVVDSYLAACKAVGKQLWIRWCEAIITPSGDTESGTRTVPTWICSALGGAQNAQVDYNQADGHFGVMSKRYSAALNTYWIAFLKAFVARYDNEPFMEGFSIYEETAADVGTTGTSVTLATPGADYSEAGMLTQMLRIGAAVRDPAQINCQHLNVVFGANYLFRTSDNQSSWDQVFNMCINNRMGLMGPDTWIESWTYPDLPYTTDAQKHYPTQNATNANTNPNRKRGLPADDFYRGWYGGSDYRGRVLWAPDCEVTDMGGYITKNMSPVPTAADLFVVRNGLDKCHYFFFDCIYSGMGYTGNGTGAFPGAGPAQEWHTGQYPWVKTAGPTNTDHPYQ